MISSSTTIAEIVEQKIQQDQPKESENDMKKAGEMIASLTARSIQYQVFGEPSKVLLMKYVPRPKPKQNEILLRMKLSSINPSDLITIRGAYRNKICLPSTPGYEGVGHVIEHGEGVRAPAIGSRVLGLRGTGTWQDYVTIPADEAISVPESIDDNTAAQLYINPLTAWVMITEELKLKKGDTVAVNACGSAFGKIVIQFSKIFDFNVIAIVRSDFYTKELFELGAKQVINQTKQSLVSTVMELTNNKGVAAALDAVGGKDGVMLAKTVQAKGTMLHYGLLSHNPLPHEVFDPLQTGIFVKNFWLREWVHTKPLAVRKKSFTQMIEAFVTHKISLPVSKSYDPNKISDAVEMSEASNRTGKVTLKWHG